MGSTNNRLLQWYESDHAPCSLLQVVSILRRMGLAGEASVFIPPWTPSPGS